jgi:hypothetical protein
VGTAPLRRGAHRTVTGRGLTEISGRAHRDLRPTPLPLLQPAASTLCLFVLSLPAAVLLLIHGHSFCTCEELSGWSGCGFYAVYDGHGGHVRT